MKKIYFTEKDRFAARKLRLHQVEPFKQLLSILRHYQSAVDISDTGVGKTYVAAAVAKALQLPCLVICPKIVKSAWHRAATHFDDSLSVINYEALQTGRSDFGYWEKASAGIAKREIYFTCVCCQLKVDFGNFSKCYCHPLGIHCIDQKKKPQNLGRFIFNGAVKFIIADEIHRCGGIDSLNAEMLIAAKRQGIKTLGLSATAACNPLQMRALGFLLDLHGDKHDVMGGIMPNPLPPMRLLRPNFYRWAARYGCRRDPVFHGWRWPISAEKQIETMKDIRDSIIPARGVRVRVADIPGFPECTISPELYDIDDANKINGLYGQMAIPLSVLAKRKESDKAPDSAITQMLRARQKIELLKVPIAAELAADDVDKGYSSVIFVNFRQTLDELAARFPHACLIYGGQKSTDRDYHINNFQSNIRRMIVVMADAGGVGLGLHDTDGRYPRIANVMPNFSAVSMQQIFGRLPRDGGKSKCYYRILLAANTIETRIHRAVSAKRNNMAALNDGDLNPYIEP